MVAHLDSVTSLAVDQHGLYLISGSHDCSIRCLRARWLLVSVSFQKHSVFKSLSRLWNLESKTCVQEITAHRKKFDESIFDVAFHPSRPYIARCALNIVVDQVSSLIFSSVLARMLSLKCSSEASGQQGLVKTSILTLYHRFKNIFHLAVLHQKFQKCKHDWNFSRALLLLKLEP